MKLTVGITFGNAAMENLNDAINSLERLVDLLKFINDQGHHADNSLGGNMMDINGNCVGEWDINDKD